MVDTTTSTPSFNTILLIQYSESISMNNLTVDEVVSSMCPSEKDITRKKEKKLLKKSKKKISEKKKHKETKEEKKKHKKSKKRSIETSEQESSEEINRSFNIEEDNANETAIKWKDGGDDDVNMQVLPKKRRITIARNDIPTSNTNVGSIHPPSYVPRPLVESSALPPHVHNEHLLSETDVLEQQYPVTLLLFYQYVEPVWDDATYKVVQEQVYDIGTSLSITGRMRVAKEGLNCTLSGTRTNIVQFCHQLRLWKPKEFDQTEFKLTTHLLHKHQFPNLKIIPVSELVNYGLPVNGNKAPPIQQYSGTHLEPIEYHQKLGEPNTVIIDVRNHYEATIGHFNIPETNKQSSKFLDPKMRKSTEFPIWLDDETTKEQLKGKQVLMYCTGGIRCERASALLKYKIANDPTMQQLNIQGVYQLQGGIDKYFKEFPDGGYWIGKNYTFDKRCAHAPVEKTIIADTRTDTSITANTESMPSSATAQVISDESNHVPLGKCAACKKPWDKYGGKPCRCPTCGVPNLICKDCFTNHPKKIKKSIRCDLCVEQNIQSKKVLRTKEHDEFIQYEQRNQALLNIAAIGTVSGASVQTGLPTSTISATKNMNTDGITRLFLRNMCRKNITDDILVDALPHVTHLVWKNDKHGTFLGQGWVEMKRATDAAQAVEQSGKIMICGRPLYIEYQPPDGKDLWPPPRSAVNRKGAGAKEMP
jgi:predicted sulfurtransferase